MLNLMHGGMRCLTTLRPFEQLFEVERWRRELVAEFERIDGGVGGGFVQVAGIRRGRRWWNGTKRRIKRGTLVPPWCSCQLRLHHTSD